LLLFHHSIDQNHQHINATRLGKGKHQNYKLPAAARTTITYAKPSFDQSQELRPCHI